ncbi:MAG TPA: efflux RND transporter periplasmic adaptor subunit [Burkholderiales bacterium]|jgi:RND family efflux transporter MFP subunit|nr:efflux RND transporter periplasmic adaptor subunit [Burkholderiales bacterium]
MRFRLVMMAAVAALAAGCAKQEAKIESPRPVRTAIVAEGGAVEWALSGEVRARYETRLAFRLPGQMLERKVEVGDLVKAGQAVAVLDARDARLGDASARAQLAQAESQAALAEADLQRFAGLRAKNFISQAEYDRREAQAYQAREQAAAARAQAAQAANQVTYTLLTAPHAGVITALEAEAGQVLSAGQTVARLARPEELEVAVSVPEHRLEAFRDTGEYEVRLWSARGKSYRGRLRELSPIADPASRTYAARISLQDEDGGLAIGMTAELRVRAPGDAVAQVPLSALFHRDGRPAVWVLDNDRVRLVEVSTGEVAGNTVAIQAGVQAGQRIVTAGVNRLADRQRVAPIDAPRGAPQLIAGQP